VQNAFILDDVAVVVQHWFEVGPSGDEHGARVEVRVIERYAHEGSESASQRFTLTRPLFRADLFDLIGQDPGNMARAHFHPDFVGFEPVDRHWDEALIRDPFEWLSEQLTDLSPILSNSALPPVTQYKAALQIAWIADDVVAVARKRAGGKCLSQAQCLAMTTEASEIVQLMLDEFRNGAPDPRLANGSTFQAAGTTDDRR
jgi:hypothetical protein